MYIKSLLRKSLPSHQGELNEVDSTMSGIVDAMDHMGDLVLSRHLIRGQLHSFQFYKLLTVMSTDLKMDTVGCFA